jgi:cytidyltransferase-like protein
LRQCKKIGDKVVVSLNTDEFIREYKGTVPLMNYEERKHLLLGCRYVDEVVPNTGGADSKPAILQVKPDFIVVGSDWASKDYYKQMQFTQEWLDEQGIVLCFVPYTIGISTSDLKERLNGKK